MKNQTYIILLQESARRGLSLGKYLNQIINKEAEVLQADGHPAVQAICICCGAKATVEAHGQGQQKFFVCPKHKGMARKLRGWKNLGEEG